MSTQLTLRQVALVAVQDVATGELRRVPRLIVQTPFKKPKGQELSDEQMAKLNPLKIFGLTFILAWIISYNLAAFLGAPGTTWRWGIAAGLLAGVGWAATQFIIIALFEQRSWKYMAINCGYVMVYFAVIGFILGIWR